MTPWDLIVWALAIGTSIVIVGIALAVVFLFLDRS